MKNKNLAILAALVLLFSGFTGGFFLGRNTRVSAIQTTRTVYETVPPETVVVLKEVLVTLPPETTSPAPEATEGNSRSSSTSSEASSKKTEKKSSESKVSYPININTATKHQLDALPGIGEVLAQRIIDYRSANGDFSSVDELIKVKGIGEKTLEKLRPYATV